MALKELRVFSTAWEAGMAKSILESQGIHPVVEDTVGRKYAIMTADAFGKGVKMFVDESEFQRAADILAEWDAAEPLKNVDWQDEGEDEGDEPCDEPEEEPEEPPPLPPGYGSCED